MPSSETPQFPPGYERPGCPEVCQNGTLMATGRVGRVYGGCMEGVWRVYGGCMEGVWRGNGGGTEGERCGKGGGKAGTRGHRAGPPVCHFGTQPLIVSNVNQQSIPEQPFP